ncbi:DUF4354 family protein [Pantoea agglomerans]|uniref:DUF4354 family protein n=1 Tax=Enterobacter agglomerans TaxID=549 RepID=UPI001654543E|nr:DUF4354 family protein [Pantoea agglomerans]
MFIYILRFFIAIFSVFSITGAFCASSSPDMTVFALKEKEGSVWNSRTGQAQYMASFNVTVNNNSKETVKYGKDNKMCFFAFGSNGVSVQSSGVQYELIATDYKPGESRSGVVYFTSSTDNIFNLPFIKLEDGKACVSHPDK